MNECPPRPTTTRRWIALTTLMVTLALVSRGDAFLGILSQLADPDGCIVDSSTPIAGCTNTGKALAGSQSVTVSPDGKHVYVAAVFSNAVAIFSRDKTTGKLTQLADPDGCIVDGPSPDITGCTNTGKAISSPTSVAVSPDGKHVYVASSFSDAVAIFSRDKGTGKLTQLADPDGCIVDGSIAGCTNTGKALSGSHSVAVSPDGKHVYVTAAASSAVAIFSRDKSTGKLTQLADPDGCIVNGPSTDITGCTNTGKALFAPASVVVSPDGKHVYVTSQGSDAVVVFSRDKTTGKLTQLADPDGCIVNGPSTDITGCTNTGVALDSPQSVAVSKDGKNVYVAANNSDAVAVFSRDKTTGKLTQLAGKAGCVSDGGTGGACANGAALDGAQAVAMSNDGKNVYVASDNSFAVVVLARDPKTGQLIQLDSEAGCVSEDGTSGACAVGKALEIPKGIAVSKDGKHVYVASQGSSAVAVFSRAK